MQSSAGQQQHKKPNLDRVQPHIHRVCTLCCPSIYIESTPPLHRAVISQLIDHMLLMVVSATDQELAAIDPRAEPPRARSCFGA